MLQQPVRGYDRIGNKLCSNPQNGCQTKMNDCIPAGFHLRHLSELIVCHANSLSLFLTPVFEGGGDISQVRSTLVLGAKLPALKIDKVNCGRESQEFFFFFFDIRYPSNVISRRAERRVGSWEGDRCDGPTGYTATLLKRVHLRLLRML